MKVKCITNKKSAIPQECLNKHLMHDREFLVKEKKDYVIYAITEFYDFTWYCLCDEGYTYCPMWYPFQLFEIIDDRVSRFWVFSMKERLSKMGNTTLSPFLAYPEWSLQDDYYDNLTDGEENEVRIFKTYKELMDLEFPDSSVSEIAQIGDSDWLICPICIDAWNCPNTQDGMVTCPKCKKIMNNPRYRARQKPTN